MGNKFNKSKNKVDIYKHILNFSDFIKSLIITIYSSNNRK